MHRAEKPTELTVTEPSSLAAMIDLLEPDDFDEPVPLALLSGIHGIYTHGVVHYTGCGYTLEGWFECDGVPRPCRLDQPPGGLLTLRYHRLLPE